MVHQVSTPGLGISVGAATASVARSESAKIATVLTFPAVISVDNQGLASLPTDRSPIATPGDIAEVIDDFAWRVGDPVQISTEAGAGFSGAELTAIAARDLVMAVIGSDSHDKTDREPVVFAAPTALPPLAINSLTAALASTLSNPVTVISEAQATVHALRDRADLPDEFTALVYDFGASSLDISVATVANGGLADISAARRVEEISGRHIDHLVLRHVLGAITDQFGEFDTTDPAVLEDIRVLKDRCRRAKEDLSAQTDVTISVKVGSIDTEVRLVRGELENLLVDPLQDSMHLALAALDQLPDDRRLDAVFLAGGGAATPLVAELLSARLEVPIIGSDNPGDVVATGAARWAAHLAAREAAATISTSEASVVGTAPTTMLAALESAPTQSHTIVAAPRPTATTRRRLPTGRKIAIAAVVAAALAVITAGGVAVGTDNGPVSDAKTTTAATTDTAPTDSQTASATTESTTSTQSASGNVTGGSAATRPGATTTAARPAGSSAPNNPNAPAPAPSGAPAAPANPPTEVPDPPNSPSTPAPPVYTPPQLPIPTAIPTCTPLIEICLPSTRVGH